MKDDFDDAALTITELLQETPTKRACLRISTLNGLGLVRRVETEAESGLRDIVDTKYDQLGRLWLYTSPYRGATPSTTPNSITRDALGRPILEVTRGGHVWLQTYYNETARPSGALGSPGQTRRTVDQAGNERWVHRDALGRLVEVVEPNPKTGKVLADGHLVTIYSYDALDKLNGLKQGDQWRFFIYDSLGRLVRQTLPEKSATLNEEGKYVGAQPLLATDVFTYDERSNVTSHTDARA